MTTTQLKYGRWICLAGVPAGAVAAVASTINIVAFGLFWGGLIGFVTCEYMFRRQVTQQRAQGR